MKRTPRTPLTSDVERRVGAWVFRDHKIIGRCTHAICQCAANHYEPAACMNFRKPKEAPMSLTAKVLSILDNWLDIHAHAIPFSKQMELNDRVAGAIARDQDTVGAVGATGTINPPPVERYCVVSVDAFQRRWFGTREAAVQHAGKLFRAGDQRQSKLMVVKAITVVEKPSPPPPSMREPVEADFVKKYYARN